MLAIAEQICKALRLAGFEGVDTEAHDPGDAIPM